MLIALLAVLGVNLIVIVVVLLAVLSRKRWVKRQPGAFQGAIRVADGEIEGLGPVFVPQRDPRHRQLGRATPGPPRRGQTARRSPRRRAGHDRKRNRRDRDEDRELVLTTSSVRRHRRRPARALLRSRNAGANARKVETCVHQSDRVMHGHPGSTRLLGR